MWELEGLEGEVEVGKEETVEEVLAKIDETLKIALKNMKQLKSVVGIRGYGLKGLELEEDADR